MRRQRPQLTVSLFPFLSVLLCTLGSLILLLLVLDQKARKQRAEEFARQHALAQAAQAEADRLAAELEAEAARRQAELQQQAEAKLERVRNERDQLLARQRELAEEEAQKRSAEAAAEQELAQARQRLDAERRSTNDVRRTLEAARAGAEPIQQRRAAAEASLALLHEQVAALEQTVRRLQIAAAQPRPPVYSLVPYRGRLGTNRKPIYLECVGQQVFFRPDGVNLFLTDLLESGRLHREIEERARARNLPSEERPYVLLLIRPSGIPLYYGVLRSLQDAPIDLGYEFVDEEWNLDFSDPGPNDVVADSTANGQRGTERAWGGTEHAGGVVPGGSGLFRGGSQGVQPGGSTSQPGSGGAAQNPTPAGGGTPGTLTLGQPLVARAPQPGAPRPVQSPEPKPAQDREPRPTPRSVGGGGAKNAGEKGEGQSSERSRPAAPTPVGGALQRDVPIMIECRAEGIVFWPEQVKVSLDELRQADNGLVARVKDAAERRQRTGLARPTLRVFIRPDGLRTYYRTAALLEPFQLRESTEMLRADTKIEALIP